MDHKLTEIGEGKHPFVIRKGVIHDQEERYHDKDGQEQDIRNGQFLRLIKNAENVLITSFPF